MDKKSSKKDIEAINKTSRLQDEIKKFTKKISISDSAFISIIENSSDGIVILDINKKVVYVNYAALKLLDCELDDLMGKSLKLNIHAGLFENQKKTQEIKISKSDGSKLVIEVAISQITWNNKTGYVVNFHEIVGGKTSQGALDYASTHDFLTGLPNRVYIENELTKLIKQYKNTNQYIALLYIDLDDFKIANEYLGYEAGDLLLKEVSIVLKKCVRQSDVVGRLGSDEFAIIISGLRKTDYAATISHNILDSLSQPFDLNGKEFLTNASIGIAIFPFSGTTASELIMNANVAMFLSKEKGKNQYQFFSEQLNQQNQRNILILNGLRNMVRNNELFLCYQPIIELKTTRCIGIEALLRWKHPRLGILLPDEFLTFVEESQFVFSIGNWVMRQALLGYHKIASESLFISINIFPGELIDSSISDRVLSSAHELKIPTNKVILEITESTLLKDIDSTIKKLNHLSKIGIQIAIDDYGTGYSSLNYIKKLPVSLLKIDKTFVQDIQKDPNNTIILKSTIQMAHNLGLKVVAEGVETIEQLEFLKQLNCDLGQGFYFSRPLLLKELKEFLKHEK